MIGRGGAQDIAGGGPDYLQVVEASRTSADLGAWIDAVNARDGFGFRLDRARGSGARCANEKADFSGRGVPGVLITTGTHADDRMPSDDLDGIDFAKYARVSQFIAALAADIANRPARAALDKSTQDGKGVCAG
jgi:hypothetical protein